jgi:hypothetical protein
MCFSVPTAGALVTSFLCSRSRSVKLWWLNLMLWGGALFGLIDHLWNGELFVVPANLASDLALGAVITAGIVALWGVVVIGTRRGAAGAADAAGEGMTGSC